MKFARIAFQRAMIPRPKCSCALTCRRQSDDVGKIRFNHVIRSKWWADGTMEKFLAQGLWIRDIFTFSCHHTAKFQSLDP